METFDDQAFRDTVNRADMVVPDGRPLVWAQRLLGRKDASQVRGSDLLLDVCRMAETQGLSIGLYGGTPETLSKLACFLKGRFPLLRMGLSLAPPFRPLHPSEMIEHVSLIRRSGIDILFVGLGCPKQERWMALNRDRLTCVMIGVGAAFDFFSGTRRTAPRWMQRAGLEWLFRLFDEPGRLWKRYLLHNTRFLFFFMLQLLGHKLRRHG
jgi:N-acetylglucosaminyldiphosphoundecaprenol N-acetyl-beta-D-mannosaminyltransferase